MEFVRKHPIVAFLSITGFCGFVGLVGGAVWNSIEHPDALASIFGLFVTGPLGLLAGIFISIVVLVGVLDKAQLDKDKPDQ